MSPEWILFWVSAILLLFSLLSFTFAVIGVYRFGFVLNRMHAGGIGDSLGMLCAVSSALIATGLRMDSLKLLLLILFMWFSSPAASHFLSQVEYFTNEHLYRYTDRRGKAGQTNGKEQTGGWI